MRALFAFVLGFPVAAVFLSGTLWAERQKPPGSFQKAEGSAPLKPLELFQGSLTLKTKEGKAVPIRVAIRHWDIPRGERVEKFTEQGFTLVQLRGGQVKTIINGKEELRKHDEFWVLPDGTPMTIVVTSEEAVLQTIAVRRP